MKKNFLVIFMLCFLTSCNIFDVSPQPFPALTVIPSRTPLVVTATPIILAPIAESPTPSIFTITPSITNDPTLTETTTTLPSTSLPVQSVQVDILGCNTSIDILHGMGEVTNAYVTIKNSGTVDLPATCSLLRAIDEDREHPDKKSCIGNLPVQKQVTFKLTVDSAYKQNTIIQVDTSSNDVLILRVDKQSCRDIGLFGGAPSDIGVVKSIQ